MIYDLIALGEKMATFTPPTGVSLANAASLSVDHGGAESNTCVGLARLGFKVAWVSRLGADTLGDRLLEALQEEGLDTRWVARDSTRPTGVMIKDPVNRRVQYYRAGSAASALRPQDIESGDVAAVLERTAELARRTTDVPIELVIEDLPPLGAGVEREIAGIAQEALTNAVRHARARKIRIHAASTRSVGWMWSTTRSPRRSARSPGTSTPRSSKRTCRPTTAA